MTKPVRLDPAAEDELANAEASEDLGGGRLIVDDRRSENGGDRGQ
jgi:hypothetical protein